MRRRRRGTSLRLSGLLSTWIALVFNKCLFAIFLPYPSPTHLHIHNTHICYLLESLSPHPLSWVLALQRCVCVCVCVSRQRERDTETARERERERGGGEREDRECVYVVGGWGVTHTHTHRCTRGWQRHGGRLRGR